MSAVDAETSRVGAGNSSFTEKSFRVFLSERSNEPAWLQALREKNWNRFIELPDPTRQEENWRFGDPRRQSFGNCSPDFGTIDGIGADQLKQSSSIIASAIARLILANDHCVEEADLPSDLRNSGVIFESLESAVLKHPDEIRRHLETESLDLGSAKQSALHAAYFRNGAYLRIPKGVVIEEPFVIYHWIKGSDIAVFPHTIVEAEDNSQATVVEVYLSADLESNAFASAATVLDASPGASITRIAAQNWNGKTVSFLLDSNNSRRDASIRNYAILLGSSACRHETHLRVSESGGNVRVRSMVAAAHDQIFDQRSRQDHQAERTCSDILCKNALLDESRSIFAGLIRVDENAQLTDAYQTNRNLILGPNAEANAMPGLEILANDVKCSHGATTGKIDEGQLFYLQSRGIPREAAQQLLTLGFFEEILAETPAELADALRLLLREKLENSLNNAISSR